VKGNNDETMKRRFAISDDRVIQRGIAASN